MGFSGPLSAEKRVTYTPTKEEPFTLLLEKSVIVVFTREETIELLLQLKWNEASMWSDLGIQQAWAENYPSYPAPVPFDVWARSEGDCS